MVIKKIDNNFCFELEIDHRITDMFEIVHEILHFLNQNKIEIKQKEMKSFSLE